MEVNPLTTQIIIKIQMIRQIIIKIIIITKTTIMVVARTNK